MAENSFEWESATNRAKTNYRRLCYYFMETLNAPCLAINRTRTGGEELVYYHGCSAFRLEGDPNFTRLNVFSPTKAQAQSALEDLLKRAGIE